MFVLLIIGLGVYGYLNLKADLFPAVNYPVVTVITEYDGASVSEIENDIIKPTEDEMIGISGIDTIRSGAVVGYGYTVVMFKMDVDPDAAFMDVQQAMGIVANKLPADVTHPSLKNMIKNTQPVLMLSVSGSLPYDQLASQAEDLKDQLQRIPGVGNVTLVGQQDKELQVNIDKSKLDYYGISLNTVVKKLEAENLNVPLGEVSQSERLQPLRVMGQFHNLHDIQALRINTPAGAAVPLAEIADVSLRYADPDQKLRFNAQPSIGVFIQKQNDANIIEVNEAVKEQLAELNKTLPSGLNITIAADKSTFIKATLRDVKKTCWRPSSSRP
jgi:HAE1 family hydrophobic/amphiphilic exporter-1